MDTEMQARIDVVANPLTWANARTRGRPRRRLRTPKPKGPPSRAKLVHLCHQTRFKFLPDFVDHRYALDDKGEPKLLARPSCKDCHGTGTVGFKRIHVNGVLKPIALACACNFKPKSDAQVRWFLKHGRVEIYSPDSKKVVDNEAAVD